MRPVRSSMGPLKSHVHIVLKQYESYHSANSSGFPDILFKCCIWQTCLSEKILNADSSRYVAEALDNETVYRLILRTFT